MSTFNSRCHLLANLLQSTNFECVLARQELFKFDQKEDKGWNNFDKHISRIVCKPKINLKCSTLSAHNHIYHIHLKRKVDLLIMEIVRRTSSNALSSLPLHQVKEQCHGTPQELADERWLHRKCPLHALVHKISLPYLWLLHLYIHLE